MILEVLENERHVDNRAEQIYNSTKDKQGVVGPEQACATAGAGEMGAADITPLPMTGKPYYYSILSNYSGVIG